MGWARLLGGPVRLAWDKKHSRTARRAGGDLSVRLELLEGDSKPKVQAYGVDKIKSLGRDLLGSLK